MRTDVEVTVQSGESDEARLRAIAGGAPPWRSDPATLKALAKSASPAD